MEPSMLHADAEDRRSKRRGTFTSLLELGRVDLSHIPATEDLGRSAGGSLLGVLFALLLGGAIGFGVSYGWLALPLASEAEHLKIEVSNARAAQRDAVSESVELRAAKAAAEEKQEALGKEIEEARGEADSMREEKEALQAEITRLNQEAAKRAGKRRRKGRGRRR